MTVCKFLTKIKLWIYHNKDVQMLIEEQELEPCRLHYDRTDSCRAERDVMTYSRFSDIIALGGLQQRVDESVNAADLTDETLVDLIVASEI